MNFTMYLVVLCFSLRQRPWFLGFDDFPIFILICKAEAIVLPTFQSSGGFGYLVFYVVLF